VVGSVAVAGCWRCRCALFRSLRPGWPPPRHRSAVTARFLGVGPVASRLPGVGLSLPAGLAVGGGWGVPGPVPAYGPAQIAQVPQASAGKCGN